MMIRGETARQASILKMTNNNRCTKVYNEQKNKEKSNSLSRYV